MVTRATAVATGLGVDPVHGDRGQQGAQVEADQNPPKDSTWTMAPSRSPWMAASTTRPMTTRSTMFTGASTTRSGRRDDTGAGDGKSTDSR